MIFNPIFRRRPFRLLVAAATAIAGVVLTVSTAAAAPASAANAAPASAANAAAAPASAANAAHPNRGMSKWQPGSLTSMIALELESGCSASLVRYPSSKNNDRAMMLTNGHCIESGFILPGDVVVNQPSSRTGELLDASGQTVATVHADQLLYATMTGTDVALYRLTETYKELRKSTRLTALTISSTHPVDGRAISIPSGYWRITYSCSIDGFVDTLRELIWEWQDSIRYQYPDSDCRTIGGTSGSPIIDNKTRQIVGINNTSNEGGVACTLGNPCEVGPDGSTTQTQGQNYGQQTYWFTTCLTKTNAIDLNKAGCLLPKP